MTLSFEFLNRIKKLYVNYLLLALLASTLLFVIYEGYVAITIVLFKVLTLVQGDETKFFVTFGVLFFLAGFFMGIAIAFKRSGPIRAILWWVTTGEYRIPVVLNSIFYLCLFSFFVHILEFSAVKDYDFRLLLLVVFGFAVLVFLTFVVFLRKVFGNTVEQADRRERF